MSRNDNIEHQKTKAALVSLYVKLKNKLKTSNDFQESSEENNYKSLCEMDPIIIINYIREFIDILIQEGINEKVKDYLIQKDNEPQEYESVLIKYENDIRGHIRIEHQLKLYIDNLQCEIEEKDKEIAKYKNSGNYYTDEKFIYRKVIKNLKKENACLKQENINTILKEKKYKCEILKLNTEIVILKEKNKKLNNKLALLEEISNVNGRSLSYKSSKQKPTLNNINKKVINRSTISSLFTRRNKSGTFFNCSMGNYFKNQLESSSRTLSKKHKEDKKITSNSFSKNKSVNCSDYSNKNIKRITTISTNLYKQSKNDKIQLIKEILLKKNKGNILDKSNSNNTNGNLSKKNNNINININSNTNINRDNKLNNSKSNSMILRHMNNNKYNNFSTPKKKKKINKNLSSSLITKEASNSYINNNNININIKSEKFNKS